MPMSRRVRRHSLCSVGAVAVAVVVSAALPGGVAVAAPKPPRHATRIPVAARHSVKHIDATLHRGPRKGTFRGRLVYRAKHKGAGGAHVTFFDQRGMAVKTTHVRGSTGRFSMMLPPSKAGYAICVRDTRRRGSGGVAPVSSCLGSGVWVGRHSRRSAKLFPLRPGQQVDLGTKVLTTGASITGRVADTRGRELGARITVRSVSHPDFIEARSSQRPQPRYNFADLPPSKKGYVVCVSGHAYGGRYHTNPTGYAGNCGRGVPWNNQAKDIPLDAKAVHVRSGRTLHLPDLVLHRGSAITGTITTEDSGDEVKGYEVIAFDRTGRTVSHTQSHASGYKLTSLLPDQRYRVCAVPSSNAAVRLNYFGTCYGTSAWRRTDGPAGKKVLTRKGRRTKGIDLTVAKAAEITGTIKTDYGAEDTDDTHIRAYRRSGRTVAVDDAPNHNGYHLYGLRPGRYIVCAAPGRDDDGGPTCYDARAWGGPKTPLPADAEPVTVRAGAVTSGIDLVMRDAVRIEGRTLDAKTRKPIDSLVSLYSPNGTLMQRFRTSYGLGYWFPNVPPSSRGYRVCFSGTYASRANNHDKYTYKGECYKNVHWSH